MKQKTKKKIRGSITVLMVIILLPMMTLSSIIVDSSRINMARTMISSAGDLTMNTALANYDTILKDVYGLFAMSQNMSDEELADSLKTYFSKTLVSYGVVNEAESGEYVDALIGDFKEIIANTNNGQASNFLDMNIVDFKAQKVDNSSLINPNILRNQIVEYMKYRAPINFGLSFLDSIKSFKAVQAQTNVVESQVIAQESTQDVARACSTLISSIRTYDKLIESIQSGEKAVKGVYNRNDEQIIEIKDYNTQVDKYRTIWGDNYEHINKLNLIFLVNSPDINSVYLKGLNYNASEWFIKTDNSGIVYDNSGILINPSVASNTLEAQNQVNNLIETLNNSGLEKNTSVNYIHTNYLPYDNINSACTEFLNEDAAIHSFIVYEKFLIDSDTQVQYSDVKKTLEQIYTLGKYYDNYYSKITSDIEAAQEKMNEANQKVNTAETNESNYYNNINSYVTNINNENKDFSANYEYLIDIANSDNEDLFLIVKSMLEESISMPSITKASEGKSFVNFYNFINNNYKENYVDVDYKYIKVFKEIIDSSLKNDSNYSDICKNASEFLISNSNLSFIDYMKNKMGNSIISDEFFILLNYLYTNNKTVNYINTQIQNYDAVYNEYSALKQDANNKTNDYNNKVTQRDTVAANYKNCLSNYNTFVRHYQTDIYYYDRYITTAKNIVTDKVCAVRDQFSAIKENIASIIEQLTVIEGNITITESAIKTYNNKVDAWNSANQSYGVANGADSFSKQNNADIEVSKSQYNLSSLDTLKAYVGSIKQEYQDFYNRITDSLHFKYGNRKIDTIMNNFDAVSTVSHIKAELPDIVTLDIANSKLSSLYNSDITDGIEMDNWLFLKPVLPIQFLKYLNETYRSEEQVATEQKTENEKIAKDYETTKDSLVNSSGAEVEDETETNKFGYSYKSKPDAKDVPSANKDTKTANNSQFDISKKDNGDIDVSNGFSKQSSSLGTILSGIGDIAENALENTYILSYIFNNFSYNTLIQDMVIDKEAPVSKLSQAKEYMKGDILANYVDKSKTLSNYNKNAKNNYFYGAEIEYMLYGNPNAQKNVTYTKASIYAVRFAFNSIYAFTNSKIRNATMTVGLSVQAATLGIVPYQVVQIVLQLALAAAESAIDLDMMNNGLKVAVVKTSDTWMLSLSNAVKMAGEIVAETAKDIASNTISKISSGLQQIIDAGADKIKDSIANLQTDLKAATESKIKEVVDAAFSIIQASIESKLNELQSFVDYEHKNAKAEVNRVFNGLQESLINELQNKFSGNPIAAAVLPIITEKIQFVVSSMKQQVIDVVDSASQEEIGNVIVAKMTDFKLQLVSIISACIEKVINTEAVANAVDSLTDSIHEELEDYIKQAESDLSEEASKKIKEKVTESTNNFIETYLDGKSNTIGGGVEGVGEKNNSSVASMIKFGYKDYLMLFTFISISVNDSAVLSRMADVIQLNIQNAKTADGASYQHKLTGMDNKAFKMEDAKTYISINANVKLNMLFMNMDFFTRVFDDNDTEVEGQLTPAAEIKYKGLYGY